jgi:hypothetical protein
MSRRLKVTTALLLVMGSVLIPGGTLVNGYINGLVAANVYTGLVGIKEEAGPIVENMVNLTFAGNLLKLAKTGLENAYGAPMALPTFFNDPGPNGNISSSSLNLTCLSFYFGEDLGFSATAQETIFYGEGVKDTPGYLPGLANDSINDETASWDAIDFFKLYDAAAADSAKKSEMLANYECTWTQLEHLNTYVHEYLILEKVASVLAEAAENPAHSFWALRPDLVGKGIKSTKDIAEYYFLSQWANGSLMADPGFPLPLGFMEAYGLEVGIPNPSNITLDQARALWNETSEYSLIKASGMERWKIARDDPDSAMAKTLQSIHGLSDAQMTMLYDWLNDFQYELMPFLAQYLYGLPADSTTLADMLKFGGLAIGIVMILLSGLGMYKMGRSKKLQEQPQSRWKQISDSMARNEHSNTKNGARLA